MPTHETFHSLDINQLAEMLMTEADILTEQQSSSLDPLFEMLIHSIMQTIHLFGLNLTVTEIKIRCVACALHYICESARTDIATEEQQRAIIIAQWFIHLNNLVEYGRAIHAAFFTVEEIRERNGLDSLF